MTGARVSESQPSLVGTCWDLLETGNRLTQSLTSLEQSMTGAFFVKPYKKMVITRTDAVKDAGTEAALVCLKPIDLQNNGKQNALTDGL